MAVPLSKVERIEELPSTALENVGGRLLVQYRGALMAVVGLEGPPVLTEPRQSLLVLNEGGRSVGLAIRSIDDIVEDTFDVVAAAAVGRVGNAIIGGRIAEVIDARHYLSLPAAPARLERAA